MSTCGGFVVAMKRQIVALAPLANIFGIAFGTAWFARLV